MIYDTDSYLRGLDNGNRRGYVRSHGKRNMALAFIAGMIVGAVVVMEVTASYVAHH